MGRPVAKNLCAIKHSFSNPRTTDNKNLLLFSIENISWQFWSQNFVVLFKLPPSVSRKVVVSSPLIKNQVSEDLVKI